MSKHFGKFATEAQYTAGLSSLDFPNVSLVEQTGNIHYSLAVGPKNIWDAAFGDILFYDVDGDTLITLPDEEYNTTEYPVAKFEPIGVCIYDRASYPGNKAVFMSLKWMSISTPTTGSATQSAMYYGCSNNVDLTNFPEFGTTNYTNTIELNNKLKTHLVTDNWKTSSTITNTNNNMGVWPGLETAWKFSPNGTSAEEWYAPTYYDFTKFKNNYTTINSVLENIKTKAGSSYVNSIKGNHFLATVQSNSTGQQYYLNNNSGNFFNDNRIGNGKYSRAVYFAGPEEL